MLEVNCPSVPPLNAASCAVLSLQAGFPCSPSLTGSSTKNKQTLSQIHSNGKYDLHHGNGLSIPSSILTEENYMPVSWSKPQRA
jgi:hypothetical protein